MTYEEAVLIVDEFLGNIDNSSGNDGGEAARELLDAIEYRAESLALEWYRSCVMTRFHPSHVLKEGQSTLGMVFVETQRSMVPGVLVIPDEMFSAFTDDYTGDAEVVKRSDFYNEKTA